MGKKERIQAITRLYYSNPQIQEALVKFSVGREVVPSYMMESFGKRPDILQYPSDVMGAVNKGATSFHGSEEIWENPLEINSDMSIRELGERRKDWDLLIDIDSPYLDYSKIAARLVLSVMESFGIRNYGIKFSGSKGFHIIVSGRAFPETFNEMKKRESFPEWPRTICEFLINMIRPAYNKKVGGLGLDFKALEGRTGLKKEDVTEVTCPECGRTGKKGAIVKLSCPECKTKIERKNMRITKRRLKCLNNTCPGVLEIEDSDEYYYCEYCGFNSIDKMEHFGEGTIIHTKFARESNDFREGFEEEISGNTLGGLDLVLVASRHLFRMPYSLHEKTALSSVVLRKEEIDGFEPKDARPLNVEIKDFFPKNIEGEGERLLAAALNWKGTREKEEEKFQKKQYSGKEIEITGAKEEMFPKPIKKLLEGISEGKKRGLFILLTFLKSLNFSPEKINEMIRAWNKKNDPPLKEGYVKSQIDWHLKQKKKILPPNYSNQSFYKDLNLLDGKEKTKNPLVDVMKTLRKREFS